MPASGDRFLYISQADITRINLPIAKIITQLEGAFIEKKEG
ncbi:MAG: hypothetical protein ACFFEE_10965 [Candidatus Thorarchaeota archaeon]